MRFVKFEYNINSDSIEKICEELLAEEIMEIKVIEAFSSLLKTGLATVENKAKTGKIHDGIIEVSPDEIQGKSGIVLKSNNEDSTFGIDTLEEMQINEENMKMIEAKKELEKRREEEITQRLKSKIQQSEYYQKNEHCQKNEYCQKSEYCQNEIKEENRMKGECYYSIDSVVEKKREEEMNQKLLNNLQQKDEPSQIEENKNKTKKISNEDSPLCSVEISKSVKFKDENISQRELYAEFASENIYTQFPNAHDESFENIAVRDSLTNLTINPPPVSSPPIGCIRLTEEQAVNDMSLNESYEYCKNKYKTNYLISQYAMDAAAITGRSEDTAKSWIKALRDEDIETVFDLKLMVYEDWERLPLTVFSCRAMQNMLYGINGVPPKEKQLPLNPKLREYDNKMSIKVFLEDVCESISRKELVSSWEDKLLAQDIQTVGELKSLHNEDWNRLGLTVYAFRILKNVIFKKGKVQVDFS
jgi:hypothetical protein